MEDLEQKDIAELMRQMKANGITRLELEAGGVKLSLERGTVGEARSGAADAGATALFPHENLPVASAVVTEAVAPIGHVVKSPIVGIYYSAPSPESPPFVSVGAAVSAGQILCIIEAMKLMNEVNCPVSGTIAEILVRNGDRVEFGQPMLRIV